MQGERKMEEENWFNWSVDKSRIIVGLASKPRLLSPGQASQFKGYTPHTDVNQLHRKYVFVAETVSWHYTILFNRITVLCVLALHFLQAGKYSIPPLSQPWNLSRASRQELTQNGDLENGVSVYLSNFVCKKQTICSIYKCRTSSKLNYLLKML